MKLADIDPIIKAIEARRENAEDLPPLTTGDFLRMLREASEPETQTNFDRIRAMTPEELAEFLSEYDPDDGGIKFCKADGACPHVEGCYQNDECEYFRNGVSVEEGQRAMWLYWLKAEWKEKQDEKGEQIG